MILPFEKVNKTNAVGNKAMNLADLRKEGFNVPNGFVFDCDFYKETLKSNGVDEKINALVKKLKTENIEEISKEICFLLDSVRFDEESRRTVEKLAKQDILYAVRSSADKEDLDDFSFAGQYDSFLNIEKENIEKTVIKCYKSMFSPRALAYILANRIFLEDISMCVIVQEMVKSDVSGVCFTVDPVSGKDTLMLFEVSEGLGENVVSGKTKPEQYYYDWYSSSLQCGENNLLTEEEIKSLAENCMNIQMLFGYPCDVEFAFKNGELFILQSRMITKIGHAALSEMWTTADFKDGISANSCKMMMWSLYEYAFEKSLKDFLLQLKMLPEKEIPKKLSNMFYARCYWNLSSTKKAMQTVVGYNENDFENEYGISSLSSSDEEKTRSSLVHSLRLYFCYKRYCSQRERSNQTIENKLLEKLNTYKKKLEDESVPDIKEEWYRLVHDDFLTSETNYFSQIFLNTIHRTVVAEKLTSLVSESERMKLFGNIEDISHMRPFYELWDLSRKIRQNPKIFMLFQTAELPELAELLKKADGSIYEKYNLILQKYGYHSEAELDLTRERFSENPVLLMKLLRDTVLLEDKFAPDSDRQRSEKEREAVFLSVSKKTSKRKYKKFRSEIDKIRNMLWWREEFRDISTMYYSLIRSYTLKLSDSLFSDGALKEKDDVWFLKIGDIESYIDRKITAEQLSETALKNKKYYLAYRNYVSENEIGTLQKKHSENNGQLHGICACSGKVTGKARVIESFEEIDKIRENDILVTKHTDTGWTPKFAILSGIVTEYGGALCHCAIVSREYNIPAVVGCEGATKKIKDGQTITIDGDRAVVITEE